MAAFLRGEGKERLNGVSGVYCMFSVFGLSLNTMKEDVETKEFR